MYKNLKIFFLYLGVSIYELFLSGALSPSLYLYLYLLISLVLISSSLGDSRLFLSVPETVDTVPTAYRTDFVIVLRMFFQSSFQPQRP